MADWLGYMAEDSKSKPSATERIAQQKQLSQKLNDQLRSDRLKGAAGAHAAPKPPTKNQIDKASGGASASSIPPPVAAKPQASAKPASKPLPKPPTAAAKMAAKIAEKLPEKAAPKEEPKPAAPENAVAWDPRRVRMFLTGTITLAELEGISKDEQYEIAAVGHQHLQQAHHEQAKKIFEGLAVLDPRDAYFQLALGSIAQRTGDLKEAETRYSRALETNPYLAAAYANRGEVRMLEGRMVEGAKDLLRALEEDPTCSDTATRRARATLGVVIEQLREAGIDVPALD